MASTPPVSPRKIYCAALREEEFHDGKSKNGSQSGRPKVGLLCKRILGADDFHISAADERASGACKEALSRSSARYAAAKEKASEAEQRASASEKTDGMSFSSKEELIACLKEYPLTGNRYFIEKKLNERVAEVFANSTQAPEDVRAGVVSVLRNAENLRLEPVILGALSTSLTKGLTYCAKQ
jgi:hypothetical protein